MSLSLGSGVLFGKYIVLLGGQAYYVATWGSSKIPFYWSIVIPRTRPNKSQSIRSKRSGPMNRLGKVRGVAVLRGACMFLSLAMLLFVFSSVSHAQNMPTRHVRQDVVSGRAQFLNRLPASQSMRLDVVLALRNPAELESFLHELYEPSSTSYRHIKFVQKTFQL